MLQEKEYYAFISYQRKDEKWADRLRSRLEHYRLPSSVRRQDASLPKEIRPIFRDALELASGVLAKEIEAALQNSKYLIVICSPNSAKSPWVNKEIQTFIDFGREDRIIPFIIDGTPFSDDEETECYPPALRSLKGEKELLGININEISPEAAPIKVVARMFGLKFDTLWQRYEKEQRKRRLQIIAGISALAIIAIGVAGWLWALNTQLTNKNRQLCIENLKVGSREVINLLEQGNYVEALNELGALTTLWQNDFREEAPEFEQALRTMYRYEQNDGISKVFSISLSNNQRYLGSDSSYIYVHERKEWQDEVLRFDISSGKYKDRLFPTRTQRDSVLVMEIRGQKVLYRTSHNMQQNASIRLCDLESGKDIQLLGNGIIAHILSDDCVFVYHPTQYINLHEAELITVREGQVVNRESISLPFFPEKTALKGDTLIIAHCSKVATWHTKQQQWINQMTYRQDDEIKYIDQSVLTVDPNTHRMANLRPGYGLVLYATDHRDSMVVNSRMMQASVAFNPSGTLMAVTDTFSDSLVVYATDTMIPLFRLSSTLFDGVNVEFVNENTIVASQFTSYHSVSHLSLFRIEAHFNPYLLYSPDGTHHLDTPDLGKSFEIVNDSTGECIFTFKNDGNIFRIFGFSPHGQFLAMASSKYDFALLDYHTQKVTPVIPAMENSDYLSFMESFSDDEKSFAFVWKAWKGGNYAKSDTLKIYDVTTGTMRNYVPDMQLLLIALNNDGSLLAMSDGNIIKLLRIDKLSIKPRQHLSSFQTFSIANLSVCDFCFTPDGQHLMVSYSDGTLRQWNIESGQEDSPTMRSDDAVIFRQINVSPDGQYVIGTSELKNERWIHDIWHIATGYRIDRLTDEWSWFLKSYISTDEYSPNYEAYFSHDGSPRIIINEHQLYGLSRTFSFPSFEDLLGMYGKKNKWRPIISTL